ncbi:gluconate 2-dehydrogenase subunit 3 family protein [bacterium LRH843]|nr:gluconate 2-dehydrogenase subunit 3 family protein [bacterium LRH843]
MSKQDDQNTKDTMTRRQFLRKGGYVAGGAVGGALLGGLITQQVTKPKTTEQHGGETKGAGEEQRYTQALMYFRKQEDFNVLAQACERIFPEDELGPGAIGLDVPYYIDHQLAGAWGNNARDFMLGPFYPGLKTQGFQSHLRRNEIFSQGIAMMQAYSQKNYQLNFTELTDEQQDEVLVAFEQGDVPMDGVTSPEFFTLLRMVVLEGVYADPLYGGNRDMAGWQMKGFPGSQMSYLAVIDSEEFYTEPPESLHAHMSSPVRKTK